MGAAAAAADGGSGGGGGGRCISGILRTQTGYCF